jgi:hypothetical protein
MIYFISIPNNKLFQFQFHTKKRNGNPVLGSVLENKISESSFGFEKSDPVLSELEQEANY